MAELKTKRTGASVARFLAGVTDEGQRRDSRTLMKMMKEITGTSPTMWGPSIVGFGEYHYTYASGREGDWPLTGFSPRKRMVTVYIMPGFERYPALMKKLGRYKTGKSCLYFKRLDDIDIPTLRLLIEESVKYLRAKYGVKGRR